MDRGTWRAAVHGTTNSQTQLSNLTCVYQPSWPNNRRKTPKKIRITFFSREHRIFHPDHVLDHKRSLIKCHRIVTKHSISSNYSKKYVSNILLHSICRRIHICIVRMSESRHRRNWERIRTEWKSKQNVTKLSWDEVRVLIQRKCIALTIPMANTNFNSKRWKSSPVAGNLATFIQQVFGKIKPCGKK